MMKIITGVISLLLLIGLAVPVVCAQVEVEEEEEGILLSGGVEAGLYSKYIWWGMTSGRKWRTGKTGAGEERAWDLLFNYK